MAVTRARGIDGSVTLPSGVHAAIVASWTLTVASVTSDVTGYGDTVQQNRLGVLQPSGNATGIPKFDDTDTDIGIGDIAASGSALVLQVAANCTYTFTAAAFNNITVGSVHQGNASVDFGFVNGVGSLTEAWDETS